MNYSKPFSQFVDGLTRIVTSAGGNEEEILSRGKPLLADLVSNDNWLPEEFAQPHPQYYQQYLLHADPEDRFSIVSFVWGPGQFTPIHDHTVWALIGMMRGSEKGERFALNAPGTPMTRLSEDVLTPGMVDCVSPRLGDIHRVSNVYSDKVSISVHAYGGNIGKIRRHVYAQETGGKKEFVSGYSNKDI
ncbi:cysteine dioxygenase family protein [Candidimonas nitroreducens]|uniref:Cysteine dioxygenase n=1 Tax=Candidimonas nitroreducens TaxID=683354 RepID=A0A225MWI6_9BURK|nr:cysteine dioxygenase [Candidimonas nitroreducens]OWT64180.1 cysteine dioxygenase [Candidimonas nitroreducens]